MGPSLLRHEGIDTYICIICIIKGFMEVLRDIIPKYS